MNNSFEAATFKPAQTFEETINEIKYNNLKSIASTATNPSETKSFEETFYPLCINNRVEAVKFEP